MKVDNFHIKLTIRLYFYRCLIRARYYVLCLSFIKLRFWLTSSQSFNSHDLIGNSPYCLSYSSCDVSLENLGLDQLIIS